MSAPQQSPVPPLYVGGESKPVPDPTELTRQALQREISALKDILEARLDAMDHAQSLYERNRDEVVKGVELQISQLRVLHEEKFQSVQRQFTERDVRVEQTARDTKVAVDAALQAAEKAVGKQNESFALSIDKSEAATMKQIDALNSMVQTATAGLDSKIADIKDRVARIESMGIGRIAEATESRAGAGEVRAYILMAATLIAVAIAVAGYFAGH